MKFVLVVTMMLSFSVGPNFAQSNSYEGAAFSFKLTNVNSEESKTTFRAGEEIVIKASLENNSNELFPFLVADDNYLYKFSLTKVGEILPIEYRSDNAHILSIREETPGLGRQFAPDPIFPGDTKLLATMKLYDRYENLAPGSYKMRIEYKTNKEIQVNGVSKMLRLTSEVAFQIVP